jgi:hypothetical protein
VVVRDALLALAAGKPAPDPQVEVQRSPRSARCAVPPKPAPPWTARSPGETPGVVRPDPVHSGCRPVSSTRPGSCRLARYASAGAGHRIDRPAFDTTIA